MISIFHRADLIRKIGTKQKNIPLKNISTKTDHFLSKRKEFHIFVLMKRKDIIQALIATKQTEIPFEVIPRDLELPLNSGQIITIPGVRRCGKSSLMMLAINSLVKQGVKKEQILWLGFDDERLYDMATEELDEVITSYMEMFPDIAIKDVYMFFDEIQLVAKWELFVLRIYKTYCKNIYVSGSNAQMLSEELSSALRGWPIEYEEFPLSFKEFCRFKKIESQSYLESDKAKIKNAFAEYNHSSAFPEVVLIAEKSMKERKLQGYFNTMLFRDLVEHYRLSNPEIIRYFLKRMMANLSKPTSINAIYNEIKSRGLKVSKDKLYELAEHICSIFLFFQVPKYDRSIVKENNSLNKYYCIDNGMRNAVLLPQSGDDGKLLENTVFLNLRRNRKPSDRIFYYQGIRECDFVLQQDEDIIELIQVTWDMTDKDTRQREIEGILEASRETHCTNLTIITNDEENEMTQEGLTIKIIPAWKWLLL